MGSFSGDPVGDGDEEGMDCATPRKKSNIYWREAGSYCVETVTSPMYTLGLERRASALAGVEVHTSTG